MTSASAIAKRLDGQERAIVRLIPCRVALPARQIASGAISKYHVCTFARDHAWLFDRFEPAGGTKDSRDVHRYRLNALGREVRAMVDAEGS